jgi:endonuclease YncB( thermonuclease family)
MPGLAEPHPAKVAAVLDGATLKLADGSLLKLAGLVAPGGTEPFGADARAGLAALIGDGQLRLYPAENAEDRYGRLNVQAYVVPGAGTPYWLQGAMLEGGFARVFTTADKRNCAAALLVREALARKAGRGLWALPAYAVLAADRIRPEAIGQFAIVEGRVTGVSVRGARAYLDFGPRWREDFTVEIEKPDLALFEEDGYDLAAMAGQAVRVRGWLEKLNGPMLRLTHPEQLERLGP